MGIVILVFALVIGYLAVMGCLKIRKKSRDYLNKYRGWKIRDYLDRYGEDFREERKGGN